MFDMEFSFASAKADGSWNFWAPKSTGNYAKDCALGRSHGEQLHAAMVTTGNPALFGAVVRAMIEQGSFGGMEIGFCSHFAIKLSESDDKSSR